MKRNDSLAPFLLIVPLVIGASFAAGYFFFGGHPAPTPSPAPAPMPVDTTPKPAPLRRRQVASTGQYIAPGSPKISISEVKGDPPLKRTPPVVDSEASETGVTPPPAPPVDSTDVTPPAPDATTTPAPPDGTTPPGDAAPPGDASAPPSDSNESGTAPAAVGPATGTDAPAAPASAPAPSGPLYKVQAGTFQDEKNAKNFADALRRRGYTAIAQSSADNGSTVYRVQVGVYRSRAAADQAATDLQRSGYPAYVSPK